MGIIIDIIILLVLGVTIFLGYRKGLIGVAFSICSFLISLLIAFLLYSPVSNFIINNTTIDDTIQQVIIEKLTGESKEQTKEDEIEEINASKVITNYIDDYTSEIKDVGIRSISLKLTTTIINVISIIVIFIITKFILFFFRKIADGIASIPIIKQFNKAGGILYGTLKGLLILYVLFAVISLISPMIADTGFINMIDQSFVGGFLYNENLLLKMIF